MVVIHADLDTIIYVYVALYFSYFNTNCALLSQITNARVRLFHSITCLQTIKPWKAFVIFLVLLVFFFKCGH